MFRVAAYPFLVSSDVSRTEWYVVRQIAEAGPEGAAVAHFCEGALTGYAGADFDSFVD